MKYTKKLISLLLGCVVASSMISMFSFSVHAETPSEESFLTTGDGLWVDPVENGFPLLTDDEDNMSRLLCTTYCPKYSSRR